MKTLRQWSGYGEDDKLNFDSSSFKTSEQEGSIMSANPSEMKGKRMLPPDVNQNERLQSKKAEKQRLHLKQRSLNNGANSCKND